MATIQASDVLPVRSRISWGAVMAGAFVALTMNLVLMVGGVAVGLSLANTTSDQTLGIGAGVWANLSILISLFLGGMVASACSVGENKTEAAIYGVVVWGVFFCLMALLAAGTFNTGLNALTGTSRTGTARVGGLTDDQLANYGFTAEEIEQNREKFDKLRQGGVTSDENTRRAAWWTFVGMALSVAAAVAGAVVAAGPTLVITSFRIRTAHPAGQPAVGQPADREISVQ